MSDPKESPTPPAERVRRMVAEKIRVRLSEAWPHLDEDPVFADQVAEESALAVMGLFIDEVTVQGRARRSGVWWANEPRPEATRFVLYTVPTAAKRPGEAGSKSASKEGGIDV